MALGRVLITSALCATVAGLASAQTRYDFDELDTDGDGTLTIAELEAGLDTGVDSQARPEFVLEVQDTNGDGVISRDEAGADDAIYTINPEGDDDDDDD